MNRRWALLAATPLAAAVVLVVAASLSVAQDKDDSADVAAQALVALGLKAGDCFSTVHAFVSEDVDSDVDAQAQALGKPGWVSSRFVGSAAELAQAKGGTIAASGKTTLWTLTTTEAGRKKVSLFNRVDLPSGLTSWVPGRTVTAVPCGPAS